MFNIDPDRVEHSKSWGLNGNPRHAADNGSIQERRNPHDIAIEKIAERMQVQDERIDPARDTVRYAWNNWKTTRKESKSLLKKAIRNWFRLLPCRIWWHKSEPVRHGPHWLLECKRCGAWRGDW